MTSRARSAPAEAEPSAAAPIAHRRARRAERAGRRLARRDRCGALVVFGGRSCAIKGVNPVTAYGDMFTIDVHGRRLARRHPRSAGAPIVLAALAVAVPARAGLVNVGGEGQLIIGGVGAAGCRWRSAAACRAASRWS